MGKHGIWLIRAKAVYSRTYLMKGNDILDRERRSIGRSVSCDFGSLSIFGFSRLRKPNNSPSHWDIQLRGRLTYKRHAKPADEHSARGGPPKALYLTLGRKDFWDERADLTKRELEPAGAPHTRRATSDLNSIGQVTQDQINIEGRILPRILVTWKRSAFGI